MDKPIPTDIPQDMRLRCPAETWSHLPCYRRVGHEGPHFTSFGKQQRWFEEDERILRGRQADRQVVGRRALRMSQPNKYAEIFADLDREREEVCAAWSQAPAGEDLPAPMIPECKDCGSSGRSSRRKPLQCPICGGGVWFTAWWSWRNDDRRGGVESGCASFTIEVDGTERYGLVIASNDGPFNRLKNRHVPVLVREILRLHEVEIQAIDALGRETVLGWSYPGENT